MGLFSNTSELAARLRAVERKLDAIMAHLGLDEPADGLEDVRQLARNGRKIEAIKLYREQTGAGLAEAKSVVDSL